MIGNSTFLLPETNLWIYCVDGAITDTHLRYANDFYGDWFEGGHSFLFFLNPADNVVNELIRQVPGLTLIDRYSMTYAQWQGTTTGPREIAGLIFFPPWYVSDRRNLRQAITFDPGVVFGDGTHPTTEQCIEAIDIVCRDKDVERMLDLGTGTGVLALAAVKLGCKKVIAVDYTMISARTAHRNACLNGYDGTIAVINGRAEDFVSIASDLMVANIGYDVIRKIVSSDGFLKQKWFVFSGMLQKDAQRLIIVLQNLPVRLIRIWENDSGWQTILGVVNGYSR